MTSRSDRPGGFTLIEVLVVLSLVALLLAVVPTVSAGLGGVRLRGAARTLVATMRGLQASAFGSGRPLTLAFDPRGRTWQSSLDGRRQPFPAGLDRLDLHFPGRPDAAPLLRFLPDGSVSVATLTLHGGGRQAVITVEGLTGRVRLDD